MSVRAQDRLAIALHHFQARPGNDESGQGKLCATRAGEHHRASLWSMGNVRLHVLSGAGSEFMMSTNARSIGDSFSVLNTNSTSCT